MFRWWLVPAILCAVPAAAQKNSACQAAKQEESSRYIQAIAPFHREDDRIKQDANRRKSTCRGDQSCLQRIEMEEQQALRQVRKDVSDENARHEKAMIDIASQPPCVTATLPEAPCDRAKAEETARYRLARAALTKREIDERNQHERDLIDCGLTGDCRFEADRRQDARITAWQADSDAENRRHQQELRFLQSGAACEPSREDPPFTSAPPSSRERPRESPRMVPSPGNPQQQQQQRRIDAEMQRHLRTVQEIVRQMEIENRTHENVLRQAGNDPASLAEENRRHATLMRLIRTQLDEEGRRFEENMTRLRAR